MCERRATMTSADDIAAECDALKAMLLAKNIEYADSVFEPLRIASSASPEEAIRVRIDDKLSRLRASPNHIDTCRDLAGYVILMLIMMRRNSEGP